ncbi:MAG TPA: aldo/keto reductase [Chthonomonadaceae bacterium]|nr:aldo/keto reductase [Chthonomonadaceae bacterium]
MKIKRLGRTGLKVSELCLGTMTFGAQADETVSFAILDKATEGGINFLDTADVYPVPVTATSVGRTEEIIGKWLKGKRDRVVLATKCRGKMGDKPWDEGLSRKHILQAVEDSLRRLQTDYIDLYQTHSPDLETPIEETLSALDTLVRSGKVRYIGCSNYGAWRLAQALWASDKLHLARYDCVQPRYNILFRQIEEEVLPLCREEGVGVIAYNPLAGGFLTGKYRKDADADAGTRFDVLKGKTSLYHDRYWHEAQFNAVEELKAFFEVRAKPLAQVAVAWVLQQPEITSAIIGASRPEQLDATLAAVNTPLEAEELAACDDAWFSLPRPRDPNIALR